jgi:hypothetical protein
LGKRDVIPAKAGIQVLEIGGVKNRLDAPFDSGGEGKVKNRDEAIEIFPL